VLTGSGLSKAHGQRVLFSDVTITLSPGRRVALVGGNGTGKTTLLEILLGLRRPVTGTVRILGLDPWRHRRRLAAARRAELEARLRTAVSAERFEEAARLRDELRALRTDHGP
jgi:ATPase subunit of ABC transporter with duplicated ATPase domains